MLERAGIAFTVHSYDYDPDADSIGLQVRLSPRDAAALLKSIVAPLAA